MPYVPSEYYVRVKVTADRPGDEYYLAHDLAMKLSKQNPGLTFEISEDKVWGTYTAREG